jgi:hypothetical protein
MINTTPTPAEQVVTAAQTDFVRSLMQEEGQDKTEKAKQNKKKFFKSLPIFAFFGGLVAIIPASIGATTAMGLLNTSANISAAWTLGSLMTSSINLYKNSRRAKFCLQTAQGSDMEVAKTIRDMTDTDKIINDSKKSMKKKAGLLAVGIAVCLLSSTAALVYELNFIQTICGVIGMGIGVLAGGIVLPMMRKDIRDPTRDKDVEKSLNLAQRIKATGIQARPEDRLALTNEDIFGRTADFGKVRWSNEKTVTPTEKKTVSVGMENSKGEEPTSEKDDEPPAPRAPKI